LICQSSLVPNDSKRLGELRQQYRDTLLTIANEIGASERSPANAVALMRIRKAFGVSGGSERHRVAESDVNPRVVDYVLALRRVLQEMVTLDVGDDHQAAISEMESTLNSLLRTSP
jgi:hypothetical protein